MVAAAEGATVVAVEEVDMVVAVEEVDMVAAVVVAMAVADATMEVVARVVAMTGIHITRTRLIFTWLLHWLPSLA
ncbi:predicted protein [Nematostella vectensis]|uniref:Uncharacterized protein n=1 Tax=Nematostella vectensis TaxID=45351 RepID=A7T2U0_NEMVE|nr:predicted protein [Nematostella vectensis]|eukprot:XP_001621823.1 hypothetical protein NEMVEDRAFT_v1g233826 [Nematostella vectensis]